MPKVTLPISREAGVTTTESRSAWLYAHTLPSFLYLGAAGESESLGRRGKPLHQSQRSVCPHKPRAFFLSYLHMMETHRGLLMKPVGSDCKPRGMKGKEDNGCFL